MAEVNEMVIPNKFCLRLGSCQIGGCRAEELLFQYPAVGNLFCAKDALHSVLKLGKCLCGHLRDVEDPAQVSFSAHSSLLSTLTLKPLGFGQ